MASESSFWMEQVQKQVVSRKSAEVYLSIDNRDMGVVTRGKHMKN